MSEENAQSRPIQRATQDPASLGQKWKAFGVMWLEPFNAFLSVILIIMYALGLAGWNGIVGVLSQSVLALVAGVLGGRIANAVSTINSEAVLKARGTVAVRGLNLMLRNVRALDQRVAVFLKRSEKGPESKNYEEIQQMCRVLSEEGITSIENWIDIVPEAREATIAGQLSDLKLAIDALESEKSDLMKKLESAALAEIESADLREKISIKDDRIKALEAAYKNTAQRAAADIAMNGASSNPRNRLLGLLPAYDDDEEQKVATFRTNEAFQKAAVAALRSHLHGGREGD